MPVDNQDIMTINIKLNLNDIRKPRRLWTKEELDKLVELSETYSPPQIAKKLDRSLNSIHVKLKRLKITRRKRSGWFTQTEVCEILGVDHKWLKSRNLKMVPHNPDKIPRKGKSCPWHIKEPDLKNFIRSHPEELIGKNIDIVMVVEILAGIKINNYDAV